MAIQTQRLAGIAYINADGSNYMLAGDLVYSVSSVSRKTMTGQDRVHGYAEKPHAGYIAGTLRDSAGTPASTFNAMTNVTVVLQLANGKVVTGRNMWTVDAQEVDTQEGKIAVRWEGASVEEI